MNFGELNIHELDKNKNYIFELKLNSEAISISEVVSYLKMVKDAFYGAGITNCVLVPVGEFAPISELNIKESDNNV